jgi:hypothetical protein
VNAPIKRIILKLLAPAAKAFAKLFPKQGNQFGFAIFETAMLHDWLEDQNGEIRFSRRDTPSAACLFAGGEAIAAYARAPQSIKVNGSRHP